MLAPRPRKMSIFRVSVATEKTGLSCSCIHLPKHWMKKTMCTDVKTNGDNQFACRKCDECITARKNGWVARAMAEKATSQFTFSVTLTYNDKTQKNRDGARAFRYSDVRALAARLRRQIKVKYDITQALRVITCGEVGSMKGRVHWHVILFCDVDIATLGEFRKQGQDEQLTQRDDIISEYDPGLTKQKVIRLDWTLWPHGLVAVQEPDESGIQYALKYAIKDQFSGKAARGQKRETRSELYASSYFRMSKKPPVGQAFLEQWVQRHDARLSWPTSLRLFVPNYRGYWYPLRDQRQSLLKSLFHINAKRRFLVGNNVPQYETLLARVSETEKEILTHGKVKDQVEKVTKSQLKLREKERDEAEKFRIVSRCGGALPCSECARRATAQEFDASVKAATLDFRSVGFEGETRKAFNRRKLKAYEPNICCRLRDYTETLEAFEYVRKVFGSWQAGKGQGAPDLQGEAQEQP